MTDWDLDDFVDYADRRNQGPDLWRNQGDGTFDGLANRPGVGRVQSARNGFRRKLEGKNGQRVGKDVEGLCRSADRSHRNVEAKDSGQPFEAGRIVDDEKRW